MTKVMAAAIAAVLVWSVPADAQAPSRDDRLKELSSLGKSDGEYRLGPGDLIEIGVFGVDTFRHTLRISASGVIKLPLVEPVTATGLTPAELEQRLTKLLDGEVINDPQVSVFVKEYRSQSVYVLGAVRTPGQFQINLQLKLVDVLSLAGGLQANAGDEAVIQRRTTEGDELIKINLQELLERGDASLNVAVRGGDVINIQERQAQTVYVVGDVTRAGAFQLPPRQELRISQILAWAGGPTKTAKMDQGVLLRYTDQGDRQQLTVNYSEVLNGKQEDFFVRANDIVFVPSSKMKNFGYSMLSILPSTLSYLPYYVIP